MLFGRIQFKCGNVEEAAQNHGQSKRGECLVVPNVHVGHIVLFLAKIFLLEMYHFWQPDTIDALFVASVHALPKDDTLPVEGLCPQNQYATKRAHYCIPYFPPGAFVLRETKSYEYEVGTLEQDHKYRD